MSLNPINYYNLIIISDQNSESDPVVGYPKISTSSLFHLSKTHT
jgi:hypothetical protein